MNFNIDVRSFFFASHKHVMESPRSFGSGLSKFLISLFLLVTIVGPISTDELFSSKKLVLNFITVEPLSKHKTLTHKKVVHESCAEMIIF